MSTGHRKMLATATTAVAAVAALLGTAVPANAAIHQCERSGSWIPCTTVTGIDPGSYLLVRRGPGYGYDSIEAAYSRLYNGNEVGLSCWKLGDGAFDNPNYRYWMSIELPNSRSGYVNDWYLNTGNPDVWKQQIRQCP
ncbi:hypothetical protein [Streptomyces europaeiscabiei]|uniref:hypothetical protein n=1 Tax=Streptomyces europaeiscabiei TaxID=146819 RepID=UPI002E2AF15F|nr:hypothetical protein [Streptomyces europaeiscabiei]